MEAEREQYTRREIRAIQRDTTLTQQERDRAIQQLMTSIYNPLPSSSPLPPLIVTTEMHGCIHYKRHCQIKAPCCGQFFSCRHCHNEQVVGHVINRFEIKEMQCLYCSTVQSVSNQCITCHKEMAHYFCAICHLFDDDDSEKNIWHCLSCGHCIKSATNRPHSHCFECGTCRDNDHKEYVIHSYFILFK
jgi:hypothetical protein